VCLLAYVCSGLDSASSISLLNSLHNMCQLGVNIVATLHQPRAEIYELVHSLCLLGPGGHLAYFGPAFGLETHMLRMGYRCPRDSNVSDYVMDVIAGFAQPIWTTEPVSVAETVKTISEFNHRYNYGKFKEGLQKEKELGRKRVFSARQPQDGPPSGEEEAAASGGGGGGAVERLVTLVMTPYFLRVFFVSLRRQSKIHHRSLSIAITTKFMLIVMGILIGNLFGQVALAGRPTGLFNQVMAGHLAYAIVIQAYTLKVFLADTLVRNREEGAAVAAAPVFLGKVFGSLLDIFICPWAFVVGHYPFIDAQATVQDYYLTLLFLHLALSAYFNFVAVLCGVRMGPTVASGGMVVLWAVGGISPSRTLIYERLGNFGRLLVALSPFSRSFQLNVILELNTYSSAFDPIVHSVYSSLEYTRNSADRMYVSLFLYWLLGNVFALIVLLWKKDNFGVWRRLWEVHISPTVLVLRNTRVWLALSGIWIAVLQLDDRVTEGFDRIAIYFMGSGSTESVTSGQKKTDVPTSKAVGINKVAPVDLLGPEPSQSQSQMSEVVNETVFKSQNNMSTV
jgi:hypothetical protein